MAKARAIVKRRKAVRNINSYSAIMAEQRPGQALDVTIIRAGKKMTMKVVPQ